MACLTLPRALFFTFVALLLSFGVSGCARGLDMASAYDAKRPAATIPYSGVREATRQYPDYGPIKADIVVDPIDTPKKGRSR